jgi:hypothetical protein
MNGKFSDRDLQILVFKYLCRVLKNKKIYHRFRCFIGYDMTDMTIGGMYKHNFYPTFSCMKPIADMALDVGGSENPFFYASTVKAVISAFEAILGKYDTIDEWNDGKVQQRITQLINTLIHCCVEKTITDFHQLEDIGKETFDMVCRKIFGNNFVDETEKELPDNIKKILEAQRMFMENHDVDDPRRLFGNREFMNFLKQQGYWDDLRIKTEPPSRYEPRTTRYWSNPWEMTWDGDDWI